MIDNKLTRTSRHSRLAIAVAAAWAATSMASAQDSTLSGLPARSSMSTTDVFPCSAQNSSLLQRCTASQLTTVLAPITVVGIAQGGTGATTITSARSALSAAASGANTDITSLSGLTTPLGVTQGGTGSTTAASARSVLGAAAAGTNSDITSLTGLTTALPLTTGGTGAITAAAARVNLMAAASGVNSDITSITGLTTPLSVGQGGTGYTTAAASAASYSGVLLPHAANNAALTALASTTYPVVIRDGYATPGDAPPLQYTASASACSISGGDGATQIPTADGKCWIATIPSSGMDLREWGAVANDSTDAGPALQKAGASLANGGQILVPAGRCFAIKTAVTFANPTILAGEGIPSSCLDVQANIAALTFNQWYGLRDLTISANAADAGYHAATLVSIGAAVASPSKPYVENARLVGGATLITDQYSYNTAWINDNFADCSTVCLTLSSFDTSDGGDSFLTNSTFNPAAGSVGLAVTGMSGLYVTANKFNGGAKSVYVTNSGGDVLFSNNSFEGFSSIALDFENAGSNALVKTVVTGNQISSTTNTVVAGIRFGGSTGEQYIDIESNTINHQDPTTGTAIDFSTSVLGTASITIGCGQIYGWANGIAFPTSVSQSQGITVKCSPRFGNGNHNSNDKVPVIFTGGAQIGLDSDDKTLSSSVYEQTSSNSVYSYSHKLQCAFGCVVKVTMTGSVGGVGSFVWQGAYQVEGTTVSAIGTPAITGALFDPIVQNVSGTIEVGAKMDPASAGTVLLANIQTEVTGMFTLFGLAY